MKRLIVIIFLLGFESAPVPAQSITPEAAFPIAASGMSEGVPGNNMFPAARLSEPEMVPRPSLPRMAPQLALQVFQNRMAMQREALAASDSLTTVRAELPDSSQKGEFELRRHYAAPRTLKFSAVHFTGDSFVKSNVITRVLQSEVDHVQKDPPWLTAITKANYKFSYHGTKEIDGRLVHVFSVKPHEKRVGLFKGHVYVDAYRGSLVRAEGRLVKTPSFFLSKVEFVQDYADVDGFTVPTHIHSEAKTRLVGRVVVDIFERDYRIVPTPGEQVARSMQPSTLPIPSQN